jgi:hypothetical protein
MFTLGPLAFTTPWLLLGLIALPVLWIILRAVPPAPIRRRFPGVALLLGLTDDDHQTDRTPWWLLLLRTLAAAAVIAAFAGPVLNPNPDQPGSGPLLILADGTWADARDWPARIERIDAALAEAGRAGRPTALAVLTAPPTVTPLWQDAAATALALPGLAPAAWEPDAAGIDAFAAALPEGGFDTLWLSDGLARDSRAPLLAALQSHGAVTVVQSPRPTVALRPAVVTDGALSLTAIRTPIGPETEVAVAAIGLDPAGTERQLATATAAFAAGDAEASVTFDLPAELRNRITRFELTALRSAAGVTLSDDTLRRREIALVAGGDDAEVLELLSPLHYLREALEPSADLIEGATIEDIVLANPDVILMADVASLAEGEAQDVQAWVESGGLLVRFAGPRLASEDFTALAEDPLLPVRLRSGGRSIGGTMSWGEPKSIAPFAETSPFYGLQVPDDVAVAAQVVAQPDPALAERVIAQLSDGTPLVTRKALGQGQVVLFHVTANAEWSSVPLSGLFVQMLERLAVSSGGTRPTLDDLTGTIWVPEEVMDAWGDLTPTDTLPGVPGERLAEGRPGPDMPPGLYGGEDRRLAVNVIGPDTTLAAAIWPGSVSVEGLGISRELPLKGWLLAAALAMLFVDVIASLALSGKMRGPRAGAAAMLAGLTLVIAPPQARAQEPDIFALEATSEVVLAHVLTGDAQVDDIARAGLVGLSNVLWARTAIEPALPMGVNIETDEIAFFPFLYWPVTANTPIPSREAYQKLNRYLRSGGMVLFDTRDADIAGIGSSSPEGRRLQAIAAGLDVPPLAPIPPDHVLTRTFYLLQDFPGRYAGSAIWVEAPPPDAETVEGMPFRNLNDGVTPVVIGGNDWAGAWAVDEYGTPLLPVGRGEAGERQREFALRFGVNLVMHALTGNYKSDQVHVPALLERLGQ